MGNQTNTDLVKFEAVFYGSQAPLVIFKGPELVYEMLNSTYQGIYPGRTLMGRPLLEAVPELVQTRFPEILKKVYDTGETFVSHEGAVDLENSVTGKIEKRYFNTTFSRIDYGNGEPFRILAIPNEVTEKVIARQKLEQSLRDLEAEKDLREKFVSALSHDLRTPLAVIKISAQILRGKNVDPELFQKSTGRIMNNVDRADRMIRDILDANRLNANEGIPVDCKPCLIYEVVAYVIKDLEDMHGKRFVIQNPLGEITVNCDKLAVHRMIENLASNAIKYGAENSPVTISLNRIDQWIEINVHNHGNPISTEDQKLLFQPFQRTKFAKASKQNGWGIGLSLVQGLAQAHKGLVTVESNIETGTIFKIRLPLAASS